MNGVREENRKQLLTAAVLCALFFALFRCFPLSGDDWFREGLGASLHSVGDLVRTVAEKWRTTNGRILGNVLAYSAGSRPLLRDVLRALITAGVSILLARASGLRTAAGSFLCAAAVLALPRELFREVYPWAAGYFNYVPPVALLLAAFVLAGEVFTEEPRGSALRAIALFALGFAAQLFVENVTVCTLCAAAGTVLWYLLRRRRLSPALVCWLLGAVFGAALLLASPSYAAILHGGGSYQAGVSSGLAGLLDAARENQATVFRFLLADCPLLYGGAAALLTAHFFRERRRAAEPALLALLLLATAALPLRRRLGLTDSAVSALCLAWFALASLAALRWTRGGVRARTVFFLGAALCAALPLLFVSPIGPRCLYASYVLLLGASLSLLAGFDVRHRAALPVCALLCAAVTALWAAAYLPLNVEVAEQQSLIASAMARGERTVSVPACGGETLLWEPNSAKMEYAYYYETPGDLTIVFIER